MEKCGKYQWEIWNQLNGRNPCEFRTPRSKLGVNLQKSDCYGLDSERKKVLTSSPGPLACAYIHLGVFGSVGTHLPSVKSILPYFSSPRGVAILGCESHSQAGSASLPRITYLLWTLGSPDQVPSDQENLRHLLVPSPRRSPTVGSPVDSSRHAKTWLNYSISQEANNR